MIERIASALVPWARSTMSMEGHTRRGKVHQSIQNPKVLSPRKTLRYEEQGSDRQSRRAHQADDHHRRGEAAGPQDFQRETAIMRRLCHPNIVMMLEYSHSDDIGNMPVFTVGCIQGEQYYQIADTETDSGRRLCTRSSWHRG